MAISADSCVVALLGRDDGARRQLRQALEELGAAVAFEGEPADTTGTNVLGVSPNVVIVNLEDGVDDDLDHLQVVFDDPAINVVFNDADVSRALEGWDLARWARHLAAKVLGTDLTMPPPPEGAQPLVVPDSFVPEPGAVPAPAQLEPDQTMDSFLDEALGLAGEVPVDALPQAVEADFVEEETVAALTTHDDQVEFDAAADPLDIDFASLDGALEAVDTPAPVRLASTPELVESESLHAEVVEDLSEDIARALDGMAEAAEAEHVPAPASDDESPVAEAGIEFGWEFDDAVDSLIGQDATVAPTGDEDEMLRPDEAVTFEPRSGADDGLLPRDAAVEEGFSWDASLDASGTNEAGADLGEESDTNAWPFQGSGDVQLDDAALLDDDVAALAAQLDALEASGPVAEVEAGLDFSRWEDAAAIEPDLPQVADSTAGAAPAQVETATPSALGGLSLAPMGDETVDVAPVPAARPSFDFSNLKGLSLEPLEEKRANQSPSESVDFGAFATTPATAGEPDIDPLLVAMGLVEGSVDEESGQSAIAGTIDHVIVLGASIGGPDALRIFLSELPAGVPAVFLLVQHLESGYFERLAQQLQKSSPLPIKVAAADATAVPGEVLVIPASEHVSLGTDGRLTFTPHVSVPHYTPSIDDVLRDVADQFGAKATAIIFSGMAGDAVEGAVYLTAKGGEVWAQDPASCVVSSMVDGARARGVVEFSGSPRELAQRCVARFMR
ncbi:hypothetical protein OS187_06885 [Xanthomonadaceae bacterium JHOS43]|nr:hypothetical protein [Xanthomonadaceae bacterium JHOS43]